MTLHCNVHGPMRYRPRFHWWECAGFDGEGCPLIFVTDELVYYAVADPPGVTRVFAE